MGGARGGFPPYWVLGKRGTLVPNSRQVEVTVLFERVVAPHKNNDLFRMKHLDGVVVGVNLVGGYTE